MSHNSVPSVGKIAGTVISGAMGGLGAAAVESGAVKTRSSGTSIPGVSLPNLGTGSDTSNMGIGLALGGVNGAFAGGALNTIKGALNPPTPALLSPDAISTTPTQSQTNTSSIQAQLASESATRAYGNILTSGEGLLDKPTTTSQVLLGS